MKNDSHPVYYVLRDWTKARKANNSIIAEKTERIPPLSEQVNVKCTRQVYILPH